MYRICHYFGSKRRASLQHCCGQPTSTPAHPLTHTPAGSKTATSRRLASSVAARAGPYSPGGTQSHAPSSARCSPGRCQGSTHGRRCGFIGRPGRAAFLRPGPPPGCSRASMHSSNRSSAGCARPCRPAPPSRRCARWCSSTRSQGRSARAGATSSSRVATARWRAAVAKDAIYRTTCIARSLPGAIRLVVSASQLRRGSSGQGLRSGIRYRAPDVEPRAPRCLEARSRRSAWRWHVTSVTIQAPQAHTPRSFGEVTSCRYVRGS